MTGGPCLLLLICLLIIAEELNVCYRYLAMIDRPSSSSAFPARSFWFDIFAYVTVSLSSHRVSHICVWCMLGVFLLLAFTNLGHECQNLLSLCSGMHVYTDKTSACTGNGV